ncbi:MAG: cyclic nucleotide-binding domain-containing protein, partial [Spirochaetaceae bacterium]|nr:cyclic nucleotide-binding domain-containing protein [Spirochaetaceae bacterium]
LPEQIEGILPLLEEESYKAGEDIIVEGTPNDKIRFILNGRVEVVKQGIVLYEFGEGDAFGEMEVLDVMPSAATIKTLTPLRVIAISNKALREIYKFDLKTFSLIIMNLARDISRRLRHMDDRMMKNP